MTNTPPPFFWAKTLLVALLFSVACQRENMTVPPGGQHRQLPDLAQIETHLGEIQQFIDKEEWDAAWQKSQSLTKAVLAAPAGDADQQIGRLNRMFFDIGDGLSQAKLFDISILCFELGLRLTQKRPDLYPIEIAANKAHLGLALDYLGENREALKQLESAADQLKNLEGPRADSLQVWSLYYLGAHYLNNSGDYQEAKGFYEKAIKLAETLPSWKTSISYPLSDLATCNAALGDESAAKKCFGQANKAVESLDPKFGSFIRRKILELMADGFLQAEKPETALPIFKELHYLTQKEQPKNPDGHALSKSWANLGSTYFALKNWEQTDSCFKMALAATAVFKEKSRTKGALFEQIAHLREQQNRLPEALAAIQSAYENIENGFDEAAFLKNPTLAEVRFPGEMLQLAKLRGRLERRIFQEISHKPADLENAASSFELAAALIDRIRSEFQNESSKAELISQATGLFEAAIETADTLARLTGNANWHEKAFFYAEKSKSVRLLASEREAGAQQLAGISENTRATARQLQRQIAGWQAALNDARSSGMDESGHEIRAANDTLFNLKSRQRDLARQLEKEVPHFFENKFDVRVASIGEVQKQLAESGKTGFIEYFFGKNRLWIFRVGAKSGLFCTSKIASPDLLNDIRGFMGDLATPPDFLDDPSKMAAFRQTTGRARRLAKSLIEPVFSFHELPKHLVIVPDGILGNLSFDALLTEDMPADQPLNWRSQPYLLHKSVVDYAFSATLFLEKKKPSDAPKSLAAFAPEYAEKNDPEGSNRGETIAPKVVWPNVRGGLRPLKFNQPEAQRVAELTKGTAFLAKNASKTNFKNTAADFRQLLFSMHALANDSIPELSQLVFSEDGTDDGRLYAWELCGQPLRADLVVLSACETGVGRLLNGEGIESMGRAFRLAGCPNIVMSLWQADDEATGAIVQSFFKNQLAGQGQAESLASAKRAFLAETEENRLMHPFYWATFVRVGESEPSATSFSWLVVLTGLFIFSTIVFLFFKRRAVSAA